MEEIFKFVNAPISHRTVLLCYFLRIIQSIVLTNFYMNNLGYYFDKSVVIGMSSLIDFVLSYKMVLVLLVYSICVCIVFWAIDLVVLFILVLFSLIEVPKKVNLNTLYLLKLIKLDKGIYYFKNNFSRSVIFELYTDMKDLSIKSDILIKMKLFVSIVLVSHFIFTSYNLEYCFPLNVVFWVNFIKNVTIFFSLLFLLGMVAIATHIEEIYFDLIRNEFKKDKVLDNEPT